LQEQNVSRGNDTRSSSGKKNGSIDEQRAGIFFCLGGALFLLLTTVAEAVYPNFSLKNNAISDLAAIGTNTSIIEETAILGLGLCWSLGAYYLFRNTGKKGTMILNMLPGAGFLLGGLSPENVNVIIHSVGTFAFPVGAVAVISSYSFIKTRFLRYFSVGLGTISLVSTFLIFVGYRVICGTCGYQQGMNDLLLGLGGLESMIIYPLMIWLLGLGGYLLNSRK
jgi:hypothetical membrane protein